VDLPGSDGAAGICAVIVTHNPALPRLEDSLLAVRRQVDQVLIVDNRSVAPVGEWLAAQSAAGAVEVLRMDANIGIAAALNRGIERAKVRGFASVLLLDHDSVPAECPIISGSLISMEAIGSVGLMESDLFVDYVDIEWGLRAASLGYKCFGVCGAVMDHQLGDSVRLFLGIVVPVRSPLRHYYLFRNACLLYRRRYVPLRWKLNDAYRLLLKYGFYSLMTPPRLQHFRMMTLGIAHANRAGKLG
jgi:GT2 family glycosyltransferase